MKLLLGTLLMMGFLILPSHSEAQTSSQKLATKSSSRHRFPGMFRVGPLVGPGMMAEQKDTQDNGTKTDKNVFVGGLIAGLGQGAFTIESGAMYMRMPSLAGIQQDQQDAKHTVLLNGEYVGIPVWAKYNYIEKPLSTFFVKGGAITAILVNQQNELVTLPTGGVQKVNLATNDVMAVVGFGGTTPMNENLAFIVDVSAFYGLQEVVSGARNQGFLLNLGLSYDL